jgi:hypothetical protein
LSSSDTASLRPYYLRKLIVSFNISAQFGCTDTPSMWLADNRSSTTREDISTDLTRLPSFNTSEIRAQTGVDSPTASLVATAMNDVQSNLTEDRKWRILQLIMQCSTENYKCALDVDNSVDLYSAASQDDSNGHNDILTLVSQLDQAPIDYFIPSFHYRIRLLHIHFSFQKCIIKHQSKIAEDRRIRKRARKGEQLEPLPDHGTSAKTRALKEIFQQPSLTPAQQKQLSRRIDTYTGLGHNLAYLVVQLGTGLLLALPTSTVYECHLNMSFKGSRPIEPNEYVFYTIT